MSFAPFAAIWVLLLVAAGVALIARRRPMMTIAATTITIILAAALWYLFRPEAVAPSLILVGRQWAVGETAWHLTGIILLLCAAVVVRAAVDADSRHPRAMAIALGLSAATLPVVWAADDRTRLMGMALFAAAWAILFILISPTDSDSPRFTWRGGGLPLAALFLLWAAIAVPGGRAVFGVAAAALLIVAGAAADSRAKFGAAGTALHGFPVVVAAALLGGIPGTGSISLSGVMLGTVMGLTALLLGLAWVWDRPMSLASALALSLGGVVLIAAAWAGQSALLAAVRLAIFAPMIIATAWGGVSWNLSSDVVPGPNNESRRGLSPQLFALLVAYLAVAGLPLMVGFGALAPIYESWSGATGWVLLLVTAALLSLWLAAIYQAGRATMRAATVDPATWLRGPALILPVMGLISLDLTGLEAGVVTWVAIAVPVAAGVALGHFVPDMNAFGGLLREAAALPQPLVNAAARVRGASRFAADALADALAILEGENGLIWLLGLLLLIIWIT